MTELTKPRKRVWSAICASFEDVQTALSARGLNEIPFPVTIVPWGAERHGSKCHLCASIDDVTENLVEELLTEAFPFRGVRQVHVISVKSQLQSLRRRDGTPLLWADLLRSGSFTLENT